MIEELVIYPALDFNRSEGSTASTAWKAQSNYQVKPEHWLRPLLPIMHNSVVCSSRITNCHCNRIDFIFGCGDNL